MLESLNSAVSFGRIDQYLYPYYQKDIDEGRINREEAVELLLQFSAKATEHVLLLSQAISQYHGGYLVVQAAIVGGTNAAGNDTVNNLTYVMLDVMERHPRVPFSLHLTGPLLLWLAKEKPEYLTRLRSLVAVGRLDLKGGGFYEPILALIPDDEILDVALVYPRGTTRAQGAGMALGGLAGMGGGFQGIGLVAGSIVGGKIFSDAKGLPASFVLAISPTTVYVLGRDTRVLIGGWDKLQPMIKFDRSKLRVEVHQTLVTLEITLVDTEHDATLELEAKRLGSLDVKALLELLMLSEAHLGDGAEVADGGSS